MWTMISSLKFILASVKNYQKLLTGINVFSRDFLNEVKEFFVDSEPKNVRAGIVDIINGMAFNFWINAILSILSFIGSLIHKTGSFAGIIGTLIGIGISLLIHSFTMQIMYNNRDSWHSIASKVFLALILVNIIISVFMCIGHLFSFSIFNLACRLGLILTYILILKGLLR